MKERAVNFAKCLCKGVKGSGSDKKLDSKLDRRFSMFQKPESVNVLYQKDEKYLVILVSVGEPSNNDHIEHELEYKRDCIRSHADIFKRFIKNEINITSKNKPNERLGKPYHIVFVSGDALNNYNILKESYAENSNDPKDILSILIGNKISGDIPEEIKLPDEEERDKLKKTLVGRVLALNNLDAKKSDEQIDWDNAVSKTLGKLAEEFKGLGELSGVSVSARSLKWSLPEIQDIVKKDKFKEILRFLVGEFIEDFYDLIELYNSCSNKKEKNDILYALKKNASLFDVRYVCEEIVIFYLYVLRGNIFCDGQKDQKITDDILHSYSGDIKDFLGEGLKRLSLEFDKTYGPLNCRAIDVESVSPQYFRRKTHAQYVTHGQPISLDEVRRKKPALDHMERGLILCGKITAHKNELVNDLYKVHLKSLEKLEDQKLLLGPLNYYIKLNASRSETLQSVESLEDKYVMPFLEGDEKQLLLLSESGCGKSRFLKYLVKTCWENVLCGKKNSPIPILVDMKFINIKADKQTSGEFFKNYIMKYYGLDHDDFEKSKDLKLLFLVDGYSEKRNLYFDNEKETFDQFMDKHPSWKVMVSCRTQYFREMKDENDCLGITKGAKQKVYLSPLNSEQIQSFVEHHVGNALLDVNKSNDKLSLDPEKNNYLELTGGVPLRLRMLFDVLSSKDTGRFEDSNKNIRRHEKVMGLQNESNVVVIYRSFMMLIFERHRDELKESKACNKPSKITFYKCLQELAFEMLLSNDDEVSENKIEKFMKKQNRIIFPDVFVNSLPLSCRQDDDVKKYTFEHQTFRDYFIADKIFSELRSIRISTDKETNKKSNKINIDESAISIVLLTAYPEIINFVCEMVGGNKIAIDKLLGIVKDSKLPSEEELASINEEGKESLLRKVNAAANAITILNYATFNFSGENLSGINITGADMRGAYCDGTDSTGSNLIGVQFARAWLRDANFKNCNLTGVDFGERPHFEHKYYISAVYYHSDINRLVVASGGKLYLWNTKTGQCIKKIKHKAIPWSAIYGVSMSKNGNFILIIYEREVVICSLVGDQKKIVIQREQSRWVLQAFHDTTATRYFDFSPDGQQVIGAYGDEVRIWSVTNGQKINVLQKHAGAVTNVLFSPDGRYVISAGEDKIVKVWQVKTLQEINVFDLADLDLCGDDLYSANLQFSPDGKKLALWWKMDSFVKNKKIYVISVDTHQLISELSGCPCHVSCVQFSSDGLRLVAGTEYFPLGHNASVRIWKVKDGQQIEVLAEHTGRISCVQFSSDGQEVISGSFDNTVQIRSVGSNFPLKFCQGFKSTRIQFSPDGQLLISVSLDGTVQIWSADGRKVDCVLCPPPCFGETTYSKCKQFYVVRGDMAKKTDNNSANKISINGMVYDPVWRVWSVDSEQQIAEFYRDLDVSDTMYNSRVQYSPNRMCYLRCWGDEQVGIFSVASKKLIKVLELSGSVTAAHFLSDKYVVTGSGRQVQIWSVDDEVCISTLWFGLPVNALALHSNQLVVSLLYGDLQCWIIKREGPEFKWQLKWSLIYPSPALNLSGCDVTGAQGLSPLNHRLLSQRGGVFDTVSSESKKLNRFGLRSSGEVKKLEKNTDFDQSSSESDEKISGNL